MMAGLHADNGEEQRGEVLIASADLLSGDISKGQNCPLGCISEAIKTLENSKRIWYHKSADGLEKKRIAGEMHAVPPSITGTYMPIPYKSDIEETQTLDLCNCDSSLKTQTKDFPPAVDIKTLPESDVEDPNSTASVLFFSLRCKISRFFVIKSGDETIGMCVKIVLLRANIVLLVVGNSSSSVTAGGSDPAASRNRPAVNSAGRPNPTGRLDRQHLLPQLI
ncbi:hypothetical protein Tco_0226867 [Tanacetum coccineum]